jgi:hypothetical protein
LSSNNNRDASSCNRASRSEGLSSINHLRRGGCPPTRWSRHYVCASSGWHLCRPHPQERQAVGPAGRTVEQVRTGHQFRDCQDARPDRPAVAAFGRRRR